MRIGSAMPFERSRWLRLTRIADLNGIVSSCSAKPIAFAGGGHVSERARINQQRFTVSGQLNTQRIRVAVASAACPLGAGIYHKLICDWARASHHVNPAGLEGDRSVSLFPSRQFVESSRTLCPKQPKCFFAAVIVRSFELKPVEEHCTRNERILQMLCTVTPRVKYAATIIVAKLWRTPRSVSLAKNFKHLLNGFVKGLGDWNSV